MNGFLMAFNFKRICQTLRRQPTHTVLKFFTYLCVATNMFCRSLTPCRSKRARAPPYHNLT